MRRLANVVGAAQSLILGAALVAAVVLFARGHQAEVLGSVAIAVMLGVTLAMGWMIASRMPHHPMGWLLLAISGFFLLALPAFALGHVLVDRHPEVAAWLLWYGDGGDAAWVWLPPVGLLFTQVPLRFPDGRSILLPESNNVAVAAATLSAAALFRPVLAWARRIVNRRFNRDHYDAERAVEEFAAHLREEIDPNVVVTHLLEVVDETVQPSSVGLITLHRQR